MAKTELQRILEKQQKEQQKYAREAQNRERAAAVVAGAKRLGTFRVMDKESEMLLKEILRQYDGNENNEVSFNVEGLPQYLQDSISVGYEKLQMYGVLAQAISYISGAILTLSESGKTYFEDKELAEERVENDSKIEIKEVRKQYDVFISHASKDKNVYVDSLNAAVRKLGLNIFYDTDVLSWGDNWKQVIIDGTKSSEFAIIVISNNFFDREWTERELGEFLSLQNEKHQKIVLPLLYGISLDRLKEHYPELGDIQCVSADEHNIEEVVILLARELIKRYK